MKFINYLKTIDGVSVFPMISLIMFFVFFVVLLFVVYKSDKKTLDTLANIPFDNQ
jgi:cytochrome c oxidase cbb3-type subunit 3